MADAIWMAAEFAGFFPVLNFGRIGPDPTQAQRKGQTLPEFPSHHCPELANPKKTWKRRDPSCLGALDLGTNNCRLLIARPEGAGFRTQDSFSRIVRLGEGLATSQLVSENAIQRTIDALRVCAHKLESGGVGKFRCVVTEVCRRAKNGEVFVERVRKATGLSLEIISPEEEARLTLAGCAELLEPKDDFALVFDIGGGSTELLWVRLEQGGGRRIEAFASFPFGVVTLAEKYGAEKHGDSRISSETYGEMVGEIFDQLAPFDAAHGIGKAVAARERQMLGASGTTTTLAGVALGLKRYDRSRVDGAYLGRTQAVALSADLLAMTLEERIAHPCIGRGRADLVLQGAAILEAIWKTWPVPRLRVADRGIREGILRDLAAAPANTAKAS